MTVSLPLGPLDTVKASADNNTTKKKSNIADYNTFIKLLIAQMKNQDPTNPADPTKYVSQLASFSAVEQAVQTNSKLDELLASGQISQAGNYIGKYIKGADGTEGVIKSVKIFSDGLMATLENGKEVFIGPGAVISNPEPKKLEA